MFTLFKKELKARLKSPITWGLIAVILFIAYINISSEINERKIKSYTEEHDTFYETSGKEIHGGSFENYQKLTGEDDERTYEIQVDAHDRLVKYYGKDPKNFNKANCFVDLLIAHWSVGSNNPSPFINKMLREKSLEMWDEVSEGVDFDEFNIEKGRAAFQLDQFLNFMLSARISYYMYKNDVEDFFINEPYNDESYNHMEFTYRFLITIVPFLLIAVGIITNYNTINREVKEGSTKLILTQSTPRWKYYLSKYLSGVLIVLFIIFVPMVILNIILGIKYGFKPSDYPVLYDKPGFTRFLPAFNYIEKANQVHGQYIKGISDLPHVPVEDGYFIIQRNISIIPYYQFILLSIIYMVLFTLFLVAFVQLFSALINNQILSIVAISGVYGIAYFLGRGALTERHYNLNPFTMHNSGRIVAGTQNATMLTVAIILPISIMILLTIGLKYFKKKPI